MEEKKSFSELLEEFRMARKISKTDLAKLSNLTPGYISHLTRGERATPSPEVVQALSNALNLNTDMARQLFEAAGRPYVKEVYLTTPLTEIEAEELVTDTDKEAEKHYLERVIQDTYLVGLTGIPGLISQRVPLDQVFIPLRFHSNRPRVDYPLTDEEISAYRQSQKRGTYNEDLERMLFEAEKNWITPRIDATISIADLWQSLIPQVPAAVIQGYPGVGKSTLIARLALYMARTRLSQEDSTMGGNLTPSRIPIIVRLGDYARTIIHSFPLFLLDYLKSVLNDLDIPNLDVHFEKWLKNGRCLVMFDGLDETSVDDPKIREQVQNEIKQFIHSFPRNRFLITSRVAGYDQAAFPDYTHFLIANLSFDQIEEFLPRWCRANVLKARGSINITDSVQEESINAEATRMAQGLREAIRNYPAVRQLAENPLLLTLLSVMHQNSIQLPERRVELYDVVTRTLLEHRNQINDLPWIPEHQAIAYLGPLAYRMQETGNSFVRQDEVIAELKKAIEMQEGGTPEQISKEVIKFLTRLRERGGIFILRAGDYFGFFHRTFQEYFAARHILNKINLDPEHEISHLIMQVRRSDDLWREPFLLAVAYQSGENKFLAGKILTTLLESRQGSDFNSQVHDLLVAAECIIDSKPFTIDMNLQSQVAQMLLQYYEQAQRSHKFEICLQIETVIRRWLSIIPQHTYQSALLLVLDKAITDVENITLQRSTLTLLSMIAQELDDCRAIVFDTLIPSLLALSSLPAVREYKPRPHLSTNDLTISDLALAVLSFMGRRGPTGLLVADVRQYFEDHPDHLRLLARYSLESATLLTPVVIPLSRENYERYKAAIKEWLMLRHQSQLNHITESEIEDCLVIHQNLLDCAEEVCYPSVTHLMKMLQASANHPEQSWQNVWQSYLLERLSTANATDYQKLILLWTTLFPEQKMQDVVAFRVLEDYSKNNIPLQHYAEHFIALLSNDLTEPRELRELGELRYLNYLRDVNYLSYIKFIRNMPHIRHLDYLLYLRNLKGLKHMKYLSLMRYQRYLRYRLFTEDVAQQAIERLGYASTKEDKDLLTILFGRVRQIEESRKQDEADKHELQKIAKIINDKPLYRDSDETREIMEEILEYL